MLYCHLDVKPDTEIVIGVNANNKEEAQELIDQKQWDKLLKDKILKKETYSTLKQGLYTQS